MRPWVLGSGAEDGFAVYSQPIGKERIGNDTDAHSWERCAAQYRDVIDGALSNKRG